MTTQSELPAIRAVIESYGLGAKKSLGQHFLLDLNITRKIVRQAEIEAKDTVLEIGPGPGGLSRAILETGATLYAIETDHRCVEAFDLLKDFFGEQVNIIEEDALKIDEGLLLDERRPSKIVANLPYNISTELLIKWLKQPGLWSSMTLMFQKEVAQRILADAGSKSYGRLSVISQALSRPSWGFDLPARAFTPPPKVDSTIVHFNQAARSKLDVPSLEAVTQAAFSQRRKMIRSSLKPHFREKLSAVLTDLNIEPTRRAEELTVAEYIALSAFRP